MPYDSNGNYSAVVPTGPNGQPVTQVSQGPNGSSLTGQGTLTSNKVQALISKEIG